MSIPPNLQQAISQLIAQAMPDSNQIAMAAAQTAEASITAGVTAIINSRTSQLHNEIQDAIAAIRAEAVQPPINIADIASQAARSVEAQIGSGIAAIVEQATANFKTELASTLASVKEEVDKSISFSLASLQAVAEFENELRDWTDRDRYELTRAHITKIMRELNV